MNVGLEKGTSDLNYPDNVLLDDFEEFPVENADDFKIGDLVEMNGDGEVILSVDQSNAEGCPAQEIPGFFDSVNLGRLYLGNGFIMTMFRRDESAPTVEVFIHKKLKSGYLDLVSQTEFTLASNTGFTQPKLIRECVDTKNITTLENGRSVHDHFPHLAFFCVGSADATNNLRVFVFNSITFQITIQNNVNPFGRAFANTTSSVYGLTSVFETFCLEQKLDTATNTVPVMKVLMWNKAGGSSAYYVTLTEVSYTGVVTVIAGEVNIMTADTRMVYNCVTCLDGNTGGIRPANNYKGLYTINKVMYLYQNVSTSERLEVRVLDIAGNTLTNGVASTVKTNTTEKGFAGGLVSLQDNRVIVHDVYKAQLYTVKWTGSTITTFGNQTTGAFSQIFPDVYPVTYPSIIRLGGDCVARLTPLGNTHTTSTVIGNYFFRVLSFDKCYDDAVNTHKKYKSIILHYLKENGSWGDGVAKPEPTINDPSLMQTEDGICFYDKVDRSNVSYNYIGYGVFKFLKIVENSGFFLIKENKLNNVLFSKSIRESDPSAYEYSFESFSLTSLIKDGMSCVIDKNRFIFTTSIFYNSNFRSYIKLVTTNGNNIVNELDYEIATTNINYVIKLISKNENGDFKLLLVSSNNPNLNGSVISYTFATNSFSIGVSNLLFSSSVGFVPNIEMISNDKFMIVFNNANNLYIRLYKIISNTITLVYSLPTFSASGYGMMFRKISPNAFAVTYFSTSPTGDNWTRFVRVYSISANTSGIFLQSQIGSVALSSPLLNTVSPILRGDIIPLEGLKFICYDFGHLSATVPSNRVFSRLNVYEFSPTMVDQHSYFSALKGSILNYGIQDSMGISDGGSGNILNITHYNQILTYVKLSETKIAFAVLRGGSKKICIEVYEIHSNGFKLLYSNPIWYVNEYVNTTQTNSISGLGQSCDFYIKLEVLDGVIYYNCIVSTINLAKPTFIIGKVTPRSYLGMVCKIKQNTVVVTKKPIKLNKNYEPGTYFMVTKDGCRANTKEKFLNPTIDGFSDPNSTSLLSKYQGQPYAIVDKNNYLRFVKNPEFINNGW